MSINSLAKNTCLAGIILFSLVGCTSDQKKLTTTTVTMPTYTVVPDPVLHDPPEIAGLLYSFDGPDPRNISFLADGWNIYDTEPKSVTAINDTEYITDDSRKCMHLAYHLGRQWETIWVYINKDGGNKIYDFSKIGKITIDTKGDGPDPSPYWSMVLTMKNGAQYGKLVTIPDSWKTVEFTLPAPGSKLIKDANGAFWIDGWQWYSWTATDDFSQDNIQQVVFAITPIKSADLYNIYIANLALSY